MKIDVKELTKSQVELTVEISPEEMEPFMEKAASRISESLRIPGFRPGKAPYCLVKEKAGEMAIMEEALHSIISHTYVDAVAKRKLEAVGQPKIEVEKMAPGNPLAYKAVVALLPTLKLPEYKDMKIKREEAKIEDEKVEKALEELRRMRRKEVAVDKAIEKGDKAEVDWDMLADNVPIEGGKAKKAQVFVDDSFYIPGFSKEMVGLRKGDEKEFKLKMPKDYFNKAVAGKAVDFKVKIGQVFEIELPELNDEFAKSLGKFESAKDLRVQMRKNLEDEAKDRAEQKAELKMLETLAEKAEFSAIPDVLIEAEARKMVHELQDNILRQGLKFDDYLAHIKKTEKDLQKEMAPQAEKRVKTSLIIREVANKEKIEVSAEELDKEIAKSAEMYGDRKEVQEKLESPAYRDYLENVMANRKVIEFLKNLVIS